MEGREGAVDLSLAISPDDLTGCPRCQGSGSWPPSRLRGHPTCDWCGGYGQLTRRELHHQLREQKARRLRLERMTPAERKKAHPDLRGKETTMERRAAKKQREDA